MGLRERSRRAAMRETQRAGLRLFRERGFDRVTVEKIAAAQGMAASTVFRHFGTKEAIVLWDEHDAALDDALAERFSRLGGDMSLFHAVRDAFVDTLAHLLSGEHRDAAPLLAGAALLALDVAIERWQERRGREDLAAMVHQAFATLEHLGTVR